MALLFDDSNPDFLRAGVAPTLSFPFIAAGWVYIDDPTIDQTLFSIVDASASVEHHSVVVQGTVAGDPVAARSASGGSTGTAVSSTGVSSGVWHHVFALWNASDDRRILIDGGDQGTNATSLAPSGLDRTSFGRLDHATPGEALSGRLTQWALWTPGTALSSVQLSDMISQLAAGFEPELVRPDEIQAYWPLETADHDPVISLIGSFDLTQMGSPASADGPQQLQGFSEAVVSGEQLPKQLAGSAVGQAFTNLNATYIQTLSAVGQAFTSNPVLGTKQQLTGAAFAQAITDGGEPSLTIRNLGDPVVLAANAFTDGESELLRPTINPPISGTLVNINDPAVFSLTVDGVVVDLTSDCVNMEELQVGYDGRQLSFMEIGLISSPAYENEDTVQLDVDFTGVGSAYTRLFTGRIRQREFQGVNNNEGILYQAVGTQQLANEVTLLNTTTRPEVSFTVGTTVISIVNSVTELRTRFSVRVRDAIETVFSLSATALDSIGIPATIGVPGLEQFDEVQLPETVTFQNVGFVQAVQQLAEFQPGVKVFFDESKQEWVFPNLFTVTTAKVHINSTTLEELPLTYDTDERFTAVRLLADLEDTLDEPILSKANTVDIGGTQGFISRTTVDLEEGWLPELEAEWSIIKAMNPFAGGFVTGLEDFNFFVFKRWTLPETIVPPFPGTPTQVFGTFKRWGEERAQKVHGRVNFPRREFIARFHQIDRGNPFVQGDAFGPDNMQLSYYPIQFNFTFPTSVTSDGTPTAFVTSLIDGSEFLSEIRFPSAGFAGSAFELFGVERELIQIVQRTQVTSENAERLHDLYSRVIISGELPFGGDPIENFIDLQRKVVVEHDDRVTQLETIAAFMTEWTYTFGKRGLNRIALTTDIAGLVRVQI